MLATSYPRERKYRSWWLKRTPDFHQAIYELAQKFPQGLAALPELPEESSGAVDRELATAMSIDAKKAGPGKVAGRKQEVLV